LPISAVVGVKESARAGSIQFASLDPRSIQGQFSCGGASDAFAA
jgi:hypothetical protein